MGLQSRASPPWGQMAACTAGAGMCPQPGLSFGKGTAAARCAGLFVCVYLQPEVVGNLLQQRLLRERGAVLKILHASLLAVELIPYSLRAGQAASLGWSLLRCLWRCYFLMCACSVQQQAELSCRSAWSRASYAQSQL